MHWKSEQQKIFMTKFENAQHLQIKKIRSKIVSL